VVREEYAPRHAPAPALHQTHHGSVPVVRSKVFFRMLATGIVSPDFRFEPTSSTLLAYTGFAERR
jgi:hypothetical protein